MSNARWAMAGTPRPVSRVVRVGLGHRLLAGLAAAFCLSTLLLAARLSPDPAGHGTHVELGLPACGWAVTLHRPCPTCGMTTAFAYAAHGRFWAAVRAQPFGFLLCLGTAVMLWGAIHVAATGSHLGVQAARLLTPRVLWVAAALALLAWGYKWMTWTV
ncbi:MAG: DUF2752 domain-containing protein [Phycisphaerales bacterium]|nr:DUF2752 domain-containing protein [Phycisphaerales bacterium]